MIDGHPVVGRFAPSPTGALHIGSLATAVGSYLMAKQAGGRWLLRLDDLDTPRQVPGTADDIMRTLEMLGLCWDGDVYRQSRHLEDYRYAFAMLQRTGMVYPCGCSRREIAQSASAPHGEDEHQNYTGSCRAGMKENAVIRSWRIEVKDNEICFNDMRAGRVCQRLQDFSGDFAVRRGDGEFAYQLAVVVDDHLAGVNQVVRGDDLLTSTPRQIYLQRLLGYRLPEYCHLPLVTGADGSKLSKRDNLVSSRLGNISGREQSLLLALLSFLGQNPPSGLVGCSCRAILEWGVSRFKPSAIPLLGGTVEI